VFFIFNNIVHGTKGHVAVYGSGCHPHNIIWTDAKLPSGTNSPPTEVFYSVRIIILQKIILG